MRGIVLLLAFPVFLISQQLEEAVNKSEDRGWISGGIGLAMSPWSLSSSISANYGQQLFYQCAFHRVQNINIGGGEAKHVSALSLGLGGSKVHRFFRIAVSAGPSIAVGNYSVEESNYQGFTAIGVLANIQLALTPIKELGIGIDGFININTAASFSGFTITFFLEGNK
jgi:hypothetical protein